MRSRLLNEMSILYAESALTGAAGGLIVVVYRWAISSLETLRAGAGPRILGSPGAFVLWIALASGAGLATAWMAAGSPLIKGSGIPQVKALLLERVRFDWMKELPRKFLGGVLALGAGLSMGREGPSIQLGALAGNAFDDLLNKGRNRRFLVTAGAAAGISAAFNAPLAGVIFCIEELHGNFSSVMLTASLIGSVCANAVMWAFYGSSPVFNLPITQILPLRHYFSAILVLGVLSGLAGSIFNRGLVGFQRLAKRLVADEKLRMTAAFALGAVVSILVPAIAGGGAALVDKAGSGGMAWGTIVALFAGKLLYTLVSYSSGAPGGIFLPMLSLGALMGALVEGGLGAGSGDLYLSNYILLGMTGFFVAVVRAPITGAVLVTEMAGSLTHFPAFILVSVVATLVAGAARTRPIYDLLLEQVVPTPLVEKASPPEMPRS